MTLGTTWSDALVSGAEVMAGRLSSGGRLLVHGAGQAAPDARHVVVEFMHPVTVGRRALPALEGFADRRPDDVTLAIAYGGDDPPPPADVVLSDRPPVTDGIWVDLPTDLAAAKVAAVLSYHVLWELAQLFIESEPSAGAAASASASALYPMIYDRPHEGSKTRLRADARRSAEAKIAESREVCAHARDVNRDSVVAAAERLGAARSVFAFGNGGSSTDAASAAAAIGPSAHALDDLATITALANDVTFDVVFARQLATLGRSGDCAMAFSTSGNSANLVQAAIAARRVGMTTVGLAGYDGGAMAASGAFDVMLVVPSDSVHRIQEAQCALVAYVLEVART